MIGLIFFGDIGMVTALWSTLTPGCTRVSGVGTGGKGSAASHIPSQEGATGAGCGSTQVVFLAAKTQLYKSVCMSSDKFKTFLP